MGFRTIEGYNPYTKMTAEGVPTYFGVEIEEGHFLVNHDEYHDAITKNQFWECSHPELVWEGLPRPERIYKFVRHSNATGNTLVTSVENEGLMRKVVTAHELGEELVRSVAE